MGYTMKTNIPGLLGLNEEHSTPDIPVFEENLGGAWGYANMDRTIHINSKLNDSQKEKAVEHEQEHVMQMRKGEAWFDNNNVYHQPDKSKPIQTYKRVGNGILVKGKVIPNGHSENPIEKSVYNKTGYKPTNLT
jgi:hypothetical protein